MTYAARARAQPVIPANRMICSLSIMPTVGQTDGVQSNTEKLTKEMTVG